MLIFHQITNIMEAEFKAAMEIYRQSFPENERQPIDKIEERVKAGFSDLIVGEKDGIVVFMAILYPLRGTNYILLDYIATAPDYRNQGIGAEFMMETIESLQKERKFLLLEVDDPQFGESKEDKQRRVGFYQRLGAKIFKDVKYFLPPFSSDFPTEMILMMLPAPKGMIIEGAVVRNLIQQIYRELYDRGPDDRLLKSIIGDVPGQVELVEY
ncbi:MAG TPA: N-acetyltransferase [candidate division Zixibacteria bacterium]|nr:N-acetyltransferase [candidate division Zixibacteria bacterium]